MFASTLSKALAARSSAEIAAAVATAAVVAATVATTNTNSSNNSNSYESSSDQALAQEQQNGNSIQQQQQRPQASAIFAALAATPQITHCDALLPSPRATATSIKPTKTSFTRLARRRTIHKLKAAQTKATLESKYDVDLTAPPLGEGAFGAVFIARHRSGSQEQVAVKKIPKQFTSDLNFQREMEALLHIRQHGKHPNICGLRENFEEGSFYYLVLDLVSGGEMFDHLCMQGPYSEADAARLMREVASALAFCHGIGMVHGDLKPENLMLSSDNPIHATIKIVDFGCAQVTKEQEILEGETPQEPSSYSPQNTIANTPAYCPGEILDPERRMARGIALYNKLEPSFDMWALGVILYIMLTGVHPFDLDGNATDDEIEAQVVARLAPPLRNSPITAHLSESAISLIEQLMKWEPENRLTAPDMLEHPWVRGETALREKIAGSDKRLSLYKAYQSKLEAKVFADMVQWSDNLHTTDPEGQQTSLLERAFHNLDGSKSGYITKNDLRRLSGHKDTKPTTATLPPSATSAQAITSAIPATISEDDEASGEQLSLSVFSELLADSLKSRYFPKGHIVYREDDVGEKMYFLNSGTVEVLTSDGHHSTRTQGDTFGEGALLNSSRRNTSTIKCVTPIHAIEISRQYFEKFLNSEEEHTTKIHLSEKDKTRKRLRAQQVLRKTPMGQEVAIGPGQYLFREKDQGSNLYILEDGRADVVVGDKVVYSLLPGEICGDHTVAFGRPRNTSTVCVSPEGCIFRSMNKNAFEQVLEKNPWWVKKSLRDMSLRRSFQKAIVSKTGMAFPASDEARMREVFDIADVNNSGKLELENIREMIHAFDECFTDAEVKEILDALDLDETEAVSFSEFKRMFSARPISTLNK